MYSTSSGTIASSQVWSTNALRLAVLDEFNAVLHEPDCQGVYSVSQGGGRDLAAQPVDGYASGRPSFSDGQCWKKSTKTVCPDLAAERAILCKRLTVRRKQRAELGLPGISG